MNPHKQGVNKMALVKPDFSEIADIITAGTYRVRVKTGEIKDWPNGGQYVNWELETFGDENPRIMDERLTRKLRFPVKVLLCFSPCIALRLVRLSRESSTLRSS